MKTLSLENSAMLPIRIRLSDQNITVCQHLPGDHILVDRIAQRRELLLIFRHHIAGKHLLIVVQILRHLQKLPPRSRNLFQRKPEQIFIVRLKFDHTVSYQYLIISF